MARVSRSRMILIACGTQHTVVRTAPVAPIASTTTGAIIPFPIPEPNRNGARLVSARANHLDFSGVSV
jgi:hypothetical protein